MCLLIWDSLFVFFFCASIVGGGRGGGCFKAPRFLWFCFWFKCEAAEIRPWNKEGWINCMCLSENNLKMIVDRDGDPNRYWGLVAVVRIARGGSRVHMSEHTWLIWRALYLTAHKESDNGMGLRGLSPVRGCSCHGGGSGGGCCCYSHCSSMATKAEKWIRTLGWNLKLGLFSVSVSFCVNGTQTFACMVMELNAPPSPSISFPLTGLAGLQC